MLIIKIKENITIDRALKMLKNKFVKTKQLNEIKRRKEFIKPSVKRRDEIKNAIYIQKLKQKEENEK